VTEFFFLARRIHSLSRQEDFRQVLIPTIRGGLASLLYTHTKLRWKAPLQKRVLAL
jgi:hypothetical protein